MKKYFIPVFLLLAVGMTCRAQFPLYDPATDARIRTHKIEMAQQLSRMTMEFGVSALHSNFYQAMSDYGVACDKLDRYNKCFEVLSLGSESLSVLVNLKQTYDVVKSGLKGYGDIVSEFELSLDKNKIEADMVIINSFYDVAQMVNTTVEEIRTNVENILVMAGGQTVMSQIPGVKNFKLQSRTENITNSLENINRALERFRINFKKEYVFVLNYIKIRKNFTKYGVIRPWKNKQEVVNKSLEKWKRRQSNLLKKGVYNEK